MTERYRLPEGAIVPRGKALEAALRKRYRISDFKSREDEMLPRVEVMGREYGQATLFSIIDPKGFQGLYDAEISDLCSGSNDDILFDVFGIVPAHPNERPRRRRP